MTDILESIAGTLFGSESQWFWTMVQAVVVGITLMLIYGQVRIQRHANALVALQKLDERWGSSKMTTCRRKVCESIKAGKLDISHNEEAVLNFFEEMGLHLSKGIFEIDMVWELHSYYIENYWPLLSKKVEEFRKQDRDQSWYKNAQRLFERSRKHSKKMKAPSADKSQADLGRFIKGELDYTAE